MARVYPSITEVRRGQMAFDDAGLPIPEPPPPRPTPPTPAKPPSQTKRQPRLEPSPPEPQDELPATPPPPPIEPQTRVLRQPRAGVSVNGERVDDLVLDLQVTNNSYFQADTFRMTVAMRDLGERNLAFWDKDDLEIEVFAGFGTDQPPGHSLLVGQVDDLEFDMDRRVVHLSGRDYTAELIDTKTTEKFANKTASQIAEEVAMRHGLTPVVTDTRTLAGRFYQLEHARLNDDQTEWNLLTYLAEQENMDVYVQGRELHFERRPSKASAQRWTLKYTQPSDDADFPTMPAGRVMLRRSLTLARDIVVKVVSHNTKQKRNFTVSRRTQRRTRRQGYRGSSQEPVAHVYRIPGLTEEQAIREAERRLEEISGKERVVSVELAADPRVNTRTIMVLEGTNTSFDQEYHIDEIQWSMGQDMGFVMSLTARNLVSKSRAAL